jgi:hypothetical protein
MTKFTGLRRILLSTAATRENRAAVPAKPSNAAATKIGANLVAPRLIREIEAKPDPPIWRNDKTGKLITLVITRAGRGVVGGSEAELRIQYPGLPA